eukprot:jgi/Tetstr1/443538/TSEL_031542.t1
MAGNYAVITQSHLDTIRQKVSPGTSQNQTIQDKKTRKGMSDARAAKWTNTIDAQRLHKERMREEREAAAEEERKKDDVRQARIRAEERRQQIERANKMLYDETDRVKAFNAKLLHSDTLLVNQKQITLKKDVENMYKEADKTFFKQQQAALELAEQAELAKLEERRQAALLQKEIQFEQLDELKKKIMDERKQKMLEGEILKAAAEKEKQKDIEAALRARRQAQERNLEMVRANDALQEYKAVQADRERMADEQIAGYAAQKAAMIEERKRREMLRQAEKESRRQRMIDYMEENLEKERARNEKLLAMQLNEAETKHAGDMAERNRQAADLQAAIDRSRQQQLDMKMERQLREKEEGKMFADAWTHRLEELKAEEEEEKREAFERNLHNRKLLQRQIDQKASRKAAAREEELQEALLSQIQLEEDDAMYQEYTAACLDEWGRQGKDIKPMTIHMRKEANPSFATGPDMTKSLR